MYLFYLIFLFFNYYEVFGGLFVCCLRLVLLVVGLGDDGGLLVV